MKHAALMVLISSLLKTMEISPLTSLGIDRASVACLLEFWMLYKCNREVK